MFRVINDEIKRTILLEGASDASCAQKMFVLCFAYGLHALIVYRLGGAIRRTLSKRWLVPAYYPGLLVWHCLDILVKRMYGIHIDPSASIGDGFYIGHFGGITIGCCEIGKNCSVHQMVTIGSLPGAVEDGGDKTIVGDGVWVGGHSTISKGVAVGDGATIVVGSFVCCDVKAYAMVMGNPARVIKNDFDNASLMGH